ncbi:MAG TPA: hypothetical protein VFI84_03120 [Candidatus Saccharimonadales bacterium]|nr:hypothetical protein [Candidatus Saccharimonadales bacterium]
MKQLLQTTRKTFAKHRWQKLAGIAAIVAVATVIAIFNQPVSASTILLVPDGDVTTGWTPSTGTTHWSLVDDGATDNTADYVQVLSTNTTASVTDEYTMTTIGGNYAASQIVVRIYMQSTVVQSTADTISLNARIGGTLQGATTCTPTLNTWTACTATYTGSWTDLSTLQVQIVRNIQGTGPSSGRPDTVQVANVYATVTYNGSPAAPTLNTPASAATAVSTTPVFTLRTTDPDNDYLRYKIFLFQSDCTTAVATADETASQTGWSGQDQQTSTAYTGNSVITSSTMATYTYQGILSAGTTYCWQAQAIDPGGSNNFGPLSATQSFTTNNAPAAPTLNGPASGATGVALAPAFTLRTTDAESDYLRYKIFLYQSDCTTAVATADQTSSQTGWSGQDQQTSTAYTGNSTITSSTMATYTYTGTLSPGTTYCWQAQAIDPGGSNNWGALSSTQSFTTNASPAAPTLSTPASGATGVATSPTFTLRTTDANNDYLEYKIFIYQSDCTTLVATADQTSSQTGWSGQDANGGTAYTGSSVIGSSTLATYTFSGTLYAQQTYCWQAQAIDPGGSNSWGPLSATQLFTTNSGQTMASISGNTVIKGGTRIGN